MRLINYHAELVYKNETFIILHECFKDDDGSEYQTPEQMAADTEQAREQYRAKHKLAMLETE